MPQKNVLVAMSGGVDSSVAAAMLKEQGYNVCGATMLMHENSRQDTAEDAWRVADFLGIKLYEFDFTELFEKNVVSFFVEQYTNAQTPNPCIVCNKTIKFGAFLDRALELGFDFIATGHYAVLKQESGYTTVYSTGDQKDQSYVFYTLDQEQLNHVMLPLCGLSKSHIRSQAEWYKLPVAHKPDSQDICFIPSNDYIRFIEEHTDKPCVGNFVDTDGNILGPHSGFYRYTIGQRKGLGAFGGQRFVYSIDGQSGNVTLGENPNQLCMSASLHSCNYIIGHPPQTLFDCRAKIRYGAPPAKCTVSTAGDRAAVLFPAGVRAITPGQSVVFYDGLKMLGGGIIE